LLITSFLISNTLSGFILPLGGFSARQVHVLAGYWVLVIVSIHLGLRWPMLMGLVRNLFGIGRSNAARTLVLRILAAAIAIHGIWSSFALGVGTKLAMQTTLDWWSFEDGAAGFFVHCVAIAGQYIALTYYAMKWIQQLSRRATAAPAIGIYNSPHQSKRRRKSQCFQSQSVWCCHRSWHSLVSRREATKRSHLILAPAKSRKSAGTVI